jgi:hypothetical protein
VGSETGNLVTQALGGDDGDFGGETLVGLEIKGETGVILFDEDTRSLLDSLSTNATLCK